LDPQAGLLERAAGGFSDGVEAAAASRFLGVNFGTNESG